ncbi:unnamed protein product [Schistocephalus solidus]|uniref:Secreted protein n=1 Tax=Schistocephalus solidus TaxID=70667 RepID=A0A183T208_SCHSO|nr:unnamed protein product [Schistocephalus solidus]
MTCRFFLINFLVADRVLLLCRVGFEDSCRSGIPFIRIRSTTSGHRSHHMGLFGYVHIHDGGIQRDASTTNTPSTPVNTTNPNPLMSATTTTGQHGHHKPDPNIKQPLHQRMHHTLSPSSPPNLGASHVSEKCVL